MTGVHDFQRHASLQVDFQCQVDGAHTAGPEFRQNVVVAEFVAGAQLDWVRKNG